MRKSLLLLLPLLLVILAVGACTETTVTVTPEPAAAVPPERVLEGAPEVFTVEAYLGQVCSRCHGEGLVGDIGPPLLNLAEKYTPEELSAFLYAGKHGTSMPAWGGTLTISQLDAIADYLCE